MLLLRLGKIGLTMLIMLAKTVLQINRIINTITPEVDFSNSVLGYVTIKTIWTSEINHDVDQLNDLFVRLVFPFEPADPIQVKWAKVKNACDKIPSKFITSGINIGGDLPNAQAFVMEGANFTRSGKYYMEVKIIGIPAVNGFQDPIQISIISTKGSKNFITYAYNYAFANLYFSPTPGANLLIDTSPSSTVPNVDVITRIFESLIDITVNSDGGERLLLKLDKHKFPHDAGQTCEVIDVDTYFNPGSGGYECEFEDDEKTGIFFSLIDAKFKSGDKIRLMLKIENPGLPATSKLTVALMQRYSPEILDLVDLPSAFSCSSINYDPDYPKLYYGPSLLTSSPTYPSLPLFTAGTMSSAIIFNSIRVQLKLKYDIPEPSLYYIVEVGIGGSAKTSIPENFVYENLNKASSASRIAISIDPTTKNIIITGVGALSSLSMYSIGFKIALEGDETLDWTTASGFCSIIIKDAGGLVVVASKAPVGVSEAAKLIVTNNIPSAVSRPTFTHSLPATSVGADFTGITASSAGLRKGDGQQFFISANIVRDSSFVDTENWIELITNKAIEMRNTASFLTSAVSTNCVTRKSDGTDLVADIWNCGYLIMNKGTEAQEYARFRIGGKTNNFWASSTSVNYYWGWKSTSINVQNSLYADDTDAAILDSYIRIYKATGSDDISADFGIPDIQFLDNLLVQSPDKMGDIIAEFPNYYRTTVAGQDLDGSSVPTVMRITGIFTGVNTITVQKMTIFFEGIDLLFLDDQAYEIGCGNSDEFIARCYYSKGLTGGSRSCGAGTCTNKLYQDRITVHFTTNTMSLANTQFIQLIIPIKFPVGAHRSYSFGLAVASIHSGGYNDYNQVEEYRVMASVSGTTNPVTTTLASLQMSSSTVNSITSTKPRVVQIDTTIKGKVGDLYSSKIDMDCSSTTYPQCKPVSATSYYTFMFCAEWDFNEGDLLLINHQLDRPTYQQCVKDIKYVTASGIKKYCFFCPNYVDGQVEDFRTFTGMKLPDFYNDKWPPGTWGALSGVYPTYGMYYLSDLSQQVQGALEPNRLRNLKFLPTTWYRGFKSMKLTLYLTTTNKLYIGGTIQIRSNTVMPVTFVRAANPYCSIESAGVVYSCESSITGLTITIILHDNIPKGDLVVRMLGASVDAVIAELQTSFQVMTTTPLGTSDIYYVDQSDLEAFVVRFEDHPSGSINVLTVNNFNIGSRDAVAITTLNVSILLGNSKQIYSNDRVNFNLGLAGYATGTKPVWCYPINSLGQIITSMQICVANDLATDFYLASEGDSGVSLFNMVLENYYVQGTASGVFDVSIQVDDGTAYSSVQTQTPQNIPASIPVSPLSTFTVTKRFNQLGLRTEYKITVSSSKTPIRYKSSLDITFHRNFYPEMSENIHSCVIDDAGKITEVFCLATEKRVLRISGFYKEFAIGSPVTIYFVSLNQGAIQGSSEPFYAVLYDEDGKMSESKQTNFELPKKISTLTPVELRLYAMTFSSTAIRSSSSLGYNFTSVGVIANASKVHIFIEYYSYEYMILPLVMDCTLEVGGVNIASGCTRIGKRITITLGSSIADKKEASILINGLVTPNYESCKMMRIVQYIEVSDAIKFISLSEYLNTQRFDAIVDPTLIYLNFKGLTSSDFIEVNRGIYNDLDVVRMDETRLNDELYFKLLSDYSGQFKLLNPTEVQIKDSYLGESSSPIKFGCTKDAILSVFLLKVEKTERFKIGRFAALPFLVIKNTANKQRLPVPLKITIYRGYESLPMIVRLIDLPISDFTIAVSLESYDNSSLLSLKNASTLTLSKDKLIDFISIKSNHPITSDPISSANARLLLKPASDSPFDITYVDLEIADLTVDTSTKFSVDIISVSQYSCNVNIYIHMPLTIYYYIVPKTLYANITREYIEGQLKKGIYTDGLIKYGLLNLESSLEGYDICGGDLLSDTDYILKIHYLTFTVQNIATEVVSSTSATSTSVVSPITAVNSTTTVATDKFDPLYHPNINISTVSSSMDSEVMRLDYGTIYTTLRTELNAARQGYIDLTFDSELSIDQKKEVCCYFGQALNYPIENVWTIDGFRCPSQQIKDNVTYFEGESGYVALPDTQPISSSTSTTTSTRLLQRKLQGDTESITSNQIRVLLLKNLRLTQDSYAYDTLTSPLYSANFEINLGLQYSMPAFVSKTPLLESTTLTSDIDTFANITILDDRKTVSINRLKLSSTGYLYSIFMEKSGEIESLITYQHIRTRRNPVDPKAPLIGAHTKYFRSINDEYEYQVGNLSVDTTYVMYYYSSSSAPNLLPRVSPIYKNEFIIKGEFKVATFADLHGYFVAFVALLGFVIMDN